jgi:hypothetical protein
MSRGLIVVVVGDASAEDREWRTATVGVEQPENVYPGRDLENSRCQWPYTTHFDCWLVFAFSLHPG